MGASVAVFGAHADRTSALATIRASFTIFAPDVVRNEPQL
jgi:hypothetical protein